MSDPTTMSPAGFEPALPKETDLKSVALDHSAKGTLIAVSWGCNRAFAIKLHRRSNDRNRTCIPGLRCKQLVAVTILVGGNP